MISPEVKAILRSGLMNGYIADNAIFQEQRGKITFNGTSYTGQEGVYEDRWIGKRSGGGQEVVEINGQKYTRLYVGGCLENEKLAKLGIVKKQIDDFRTEAIQKLRETRLDEVTNYQSGMWDYGYDIEDEFKNDFELIEGMEQINYNGERVFLHKFFLCPVK